MMFLEQAKTFLDSIETERLYWYIGIFFILFITVNGAVIFFSYRSIRMLQKEIKTINEYRDEDVSVILRDSARVEQQRSAVDAVFSKDPDFKIGGYFDELVTTLKLGDKKVKNTEEIAQVEREDNYRESELTVKFEDMTMQDITTLLQALEENVRISTKRLEIINTSAKKPKTVELQITIATLLPKKEIS